MRVVFITPASAVRRTWPYRFGFYIYGHPDAITGPLILGHILKDAGHDVACYEELYRTPNYRKILQGVDVICLCVMTSTAPRAYNLVEKFRAIAPTARIIMGGFHPSACPDEALEHCDQVMMGEGEKVILDVIEGRNTDPIVHGEVVEDLDSVPFPDYSLLKSPVQSADVLTTRGCAYGKCTFCTSARMFAPYRERSVDNVLEELRYYKSLGFEYMNFEDDNFTANKKRAKEICRGMIEQGLVFKESFFFGRVDMGEDEELLDLLEKAHLNHVLIGIESTNQKALDAVNKGQRPADIRQCADALSRHKIRLIASLVLGIDTDTPQDIRNSVDFACDIGAYQIQPAILTPFPATPLYDQFVSEGRMLTKQWSLFDMMNVVYRPRHMTPWQLQELFFEASETFYTFSSSIEIGRRFGWNFGFRRFCLFLLSKLGVAAAEICARIAPPTNYYTLKRLDDEERAAATARGELCESDAAATNPV